ncbi:MAG: hypothetical protein Q7S92_03975 [Candidatus Diapherotrites archaeon]|nr:hypothetical protein [Candidatus Diapherotrites archaeon]
MSLEVALNKLYSGNYLRLLVIPLILFVVLSFLAFVSPGVKPGIDLQGGTSFTLRTATQISSQELVDFLESEFNLHNVSVTSVSSGTDYGFIVQFSDTLEDSDGLTASIQSRIQTQFNLEEITAFQFREIAPAVGAIFWETSVTVVIVAVILLFLVILFLFKDWVPAIVIILAGIFDALAGLAAMPFFGISLSLPTLSALLMVLGYSIDNEVLVNSRINFGVGKTPKEQAVSSFKTGMLMTITALAAVLVMTVFSFFNQMISIYEIGIVLFFGLLGDVIVTWLMNTPILLWFAEKKAAKKLAKYKR